MPTNYSLITPLLGPVTGVPADVPGTSGPVLHAKHGWELPGYFRKVIESKSVYAPGTTSPHKVGYCEKSINPNIELCGISGSNQGGSKVYLAKYGYFGPYEKTLMGYKRNRDGKLTLVSVPNPDQPYHTYVEVFKSAKPLGMLNVWKGTAQPTYQNYAGPNCLQDGYPDMSYTQTVQGKKYHRVSLGILDTYGTLVKQKINDVELELVQKAVEKARVADLGEALVDIAELRIMHKLIWKSFANVGKSLPGMLSLNSLLDARRFLDAVSAAWVTWALAVRPTLKLMEDLFQKWDKLKTDDISYWSLQASKEGIPLLQYHTSILSDMVSAGEIVQLGAPYYPYCYDSSAEILSGGYEKYVTIDGTRYDILQPLNAFPAAYQQDTRVWLNTHVNLEIQTDWKFIMSQLGLSNPIGLAWEAVPFSFIINRVFNVAKALERFDCKPYTITRIGCTHEYVYETQSTNGSKAHAIVTQRFPRSQTYAPNLTGAKLRDDEISVYGSNPWSDTDLLITIPRSIEYGGGYDVEDAGGEELTGLALFELVTVALHEMLMRYGSRMTSRERMLTKKLLK